MFQGHTVKLKKDVDRSTALKYQAAVQSTGARCHLVPAAASSGAVAPSLEKVTTPPPPPPPSPGGRDRIADRERPAMDADLAVHQNQDFYAPPGATLTDEFIPGVMELGDPRRVLAGRAVRWVSAGFEMFKLNPGVWIAVMVLWFVILVVLSMIPVLSLAVNFITPILIGGLMLGCRDLDEGEPLQVGHLFAAFQGLGGRLAALGGLQLLAFLGVGIVVGLLFFFLGASSAALLGGQFGPDAPPTGLIAMIAIPLLLGMALAVPIAMAFWFAPLLVAVHDVGVFDSIKLSFVGCLRNWLGFLLYGLILMVLFIIGMIPLGLGLLVVAPVAMASVYTSHKDIYLGNLD